MPANTRNTRRPSRAKQAWEKWEAIDRVEKGDSKASVAREMDVPESTLRGWCKNRDKIYALQLQNPKPGTVPKVAGTVPPAVGAIPAAVGAVPAAVENTAEEEMDEENTPQNLSVRNDSPFSTDSDGAMDLSRTSPLNAAPKVETNQISEIANYLETARLFQAVQQAQINLLGGGIPVSNLPRNGIPNVSPNSSSATLSTPRNVQQTTSPLAAITPEGQNVYMDMYRTMLGTMNPFNAPQVPRQYDYFRELERIRMQSLLRSATATHPVSPNQSARSSNIAENTQRSSPEMRRVSPNSARGSNVAENTQRSSPEMRRNNQTKKQESQQRSPPAPKIQPSLSTSPHPYYANGASQSNPRTSAQYSNENSSHIPEKSNQLFYQCPNGSTSSSRDQGHSDSNSTLDLSIKSESIKSESVKSENEDMELIEQEEKLADAEPENLNIQVKIEPPEIEIAAPAKQEDKTDQTKRKIRKRSLSTIVQNLNFVGEPRETGKKRKIEDAVVHGEIFLQILQDNIEQLNCLSSFQLQTIHKVINALKEVKQPEQN